MNAEKLETVLQFIPNVARKAEGLSDAGIEQFRDNPYVSCGRETGQNTNDAPDDGKRPVKMRFDLRSIPRVDVPFADELGDTSKACLEQSINLCKKTKKDPEKDRAVRFFERAQESLAQEEIQILEIADFNTTGLTGPFDDEHCVFNSLVKAKGVTNKLNLDSGGSFGIGKNAVFAVSDVQTVLYSTKARNVVDPNSQDQYAFQARTVLISHEVDGNPNTAEGYWGLPEYYPIENPEAVPNWMVREERGTSIFAICFRKHDSWAERMALSIATNFQIAVMRGDMEFEIDNGRFKINKSTLASILNNKLLEAVAAEVNQTASLERARCIFACLSSELTETHRITVKGHGNARLHILVQENMPRQVNIVRNGMFIANNLREFGCPLLSFQGTREFVAVLEPEPGQNGKALGELLKRMENPEHDNFSPERLRDDQERKKVTTLIKRLHRDLRDKIKSAAKVAESDQSNIDELARLFAADPESGDADEGAEKDPEKFTYGKAKLTTTKPTLPSTPGAGEEGGAGSSGGTGGGGGGGTGGSTGAGTGGKGSRGKVRVIKLKESRVKKEPSTGEFSHRLYFTPAMSGDVNLIVRAAGLTKATPLKVSASDRGGISHGRLVFRCEQDERVAIGVSFENGFDGPLEFICHTISGESGQ